MHPSRPLSRYSLRQAKILAAKGIRFHHRQSRQLRSFPLVLKRIALVAPNKVGSISLTHA